MKVMHVETGRHLYGGALQVFYLLRGLHDKGIENLLVCPAGSAISAAAAPFARICEVPMRGDLDVLFGWHLWRLVKRERPDILHIHSRRGADLWGSLLIRLTGQPAILTRRVDNPEAAWLVHSKYQPFKKVVTISEGIRQVLLSEGLGEEKLQCIHSAVDCDAWQVPRDRRWFEVEFGITCAQKAVGVIAQMIERKGHRLLIEAIPKIVRNVPSVRFLFLGQGPLETELKQQCVNNSVDHLVRFAGFRDDLPRVMPNLDLLVHPALMEGLGVSLLQAAACGVPIVASKVGGIPEIIRHGTNGFLIQPGSVSELERFCIELLEDTERANRFIQTGRRIVLDNFTIPTMVDGNLRLYEDVARLHLN
jgi:glycosyltransferase involved in cell wall biosynthesis